jgi:hypothetical protein
MNLSDCLVFGATNGLKEMIVPNDLQHFDFLKNYKFLIRKRIFPYFNQQIW